jgi:hypothetical protein
MSPPYLGSRTKAWVEIPIPSPPPHWQVFDAQGIYLGAVTSPPGLEVLEIGHDYLLAIVRDHLDTERLAVYELIRP